MPSLRRAWYRVSTRARPHVRGLVANVLAIAGVGCAAAGLWLVSPTLGLLLVGGYLYWVAVGAASARP